MTQRTTSLLDEVLQLPDDERSAFVERLLESFDGPQSDLDRMTDEEFDVELERRQEEARLDPSVLIPWNQVRDMR
jgi:putative addiction module component (TIGR02574 family)